MKVLLVLLLLLLLLEKDRLFFFSFSLVFFSVLSCPGGVWFGFVGGWVDGLKVEDACRMGVLGH